MYKSCPAYCVGRFFLSKYYLKLNFEKMVILTKKFYLFYI